MNSLYTFFTILICAQGLLVFGNSDSANVTCDTIHDGENRISEIYCTNGVSVSYFYGKKENTTDIQYEDGASETWTYRPDGRMKEKRITLFVDGIQFTTQTFFDSAGQIESTEQYYVLDKLRRGKIYQHGYYIEYRSDGSPETAWTYRNDKVSGPITDFYQDGSPKSITFHEGRLAHGKHIEFYPGGEIKIMGRYRLGKKDSTWSYYYPNGVLAGLEHHNSKKKRINLARYFTSEGIEIPNDDVKNGNGTLVMYEFGTIVRICDLKNYKYKRCRCE